MRRRVVNVLTLVSLIICVMSLTLVVRSFLQSDVVALPISRTSSCGAWTFRSDVVLWAGKHPREFRYGNSDLQSAGLWFAFHREIAQFRWLGTAWSVERGVLILPLWPLPIVTAIPPLRWWLRRRGGGRGYAVETSAKTTESGESTEEEAQS